MYTEWGWGYVQHRCRLKLNWIASASLGGLRSPALSHWKKKTTSDHHSVCRVIVASWVYGTGTEDAGHIHDVLRVVVRSVCAMWWVADPQCGGA